MNREKKRNPTDSRLITRLFFRLLPYQVLLLVINSANGIVDSLFAGNFIGQTGMTAIGLYCPLTHFLFAVSVTLVSGSQLLIGEAMGKNQPETVNKYFSLDIIISVIISGVTVALLIISVVTGFTSLLVSVEPDRHALNMYIIGQCLGIPALVLGQQLFSFLSMENRTRRTTVASLSCIVANIIMNTIFVVVLKLGTLGLGLGSSMGLWAFLLVMAHYYVTGRSEMKFSLKVFSWKGSAGILVRGYPGALSRFVEMFRCIIVNFLLLEYVGSVGVSAFAAVNSVMAVFWPIPFGMLAVQRMLAGIYLGEEDRTSLIELMRIVLIKCVLVQIGISAIIILLGTPFTQMFYRDVADPVYGMTLMGFRMLPLCMPLAVVSLGFCCYGQTMQKKFLSIVLPICDGALFVVAMSCLLIPFLLIKGLYLANILNGVLCLLLVIGYSFYCNRRFPRSVADLMVIPEDFGASEEEKLDISIHHMSQVPDVSLQVTEFCENRGIDKRRAFFAGLALEEMAGNVVEHGFKSDRTKHSIDIRVVHKDDDMILRLRDNCKAFDPLDRTRILENEDKTRNIGIRMVTGIAKDVQYQNLLGQNVLTIRI